MAGKPIKRTPRGIVLHPTTDGGDYCTASTSFTDRRMSVAVTVKIASLKPTCLVSQPVREVYREAERLGITWGPNCTVTVHRSKAADIRWLLIANEQALGLGWKPAYPNALTREQQKVLARFLTPDPLGAESRDFPRSDRKALDALSASRLVAMSPLTSRRYYITDDGRAFLRQLKNT